jgi:hypothetical protein
LVANDRPQQWVTQAPNVRSILSGALEEYRYNLAAGTSFAPGRPARLSKSRSLYAMRPA